MNTFVDDTACRDAEHAVAANPTDRAALAALADAWNPDSADEEATQ